MNFIGVKIKVLVFGSNGLVGSSIVRKFKEREDIDLIPSSRNDVNLFDFEKTKSFIKDVQPDVVINAAAKVGGIQANNIQRFDFIVDNLKININILESLKDFPNTKIINLGSSCIYPLDIKNPIKETSIMTGKLEETNSPYAMAKLTAIEIGDTMSREFGHEIINLMPTNLYGPNDYFNPENSHVIPGMIYKFHNAQESAQEKIYLWGDGSPLREFLFVDDLSSSILFILDNEIKETILNVGSSQEISISDLAQTVKRITNFKGEIKFDTTKPNGINRKFLDSSKLESYGWKSEIDLENGLELTYKWFLKNIDNLRL